MPDRDLKSKEELLDILNKELSKYLECENCRFGPVTGPTQADDIGCNWLAQDIDGCDMSDQECLRICAEITFKMRSKYNLK